MRVGVEGDNMKNIIYFSYYLPPSPPYANILHIISPHSNPMFFILSPSSPTLISYMRVGMGGDNMKNILYEGEGGGGER
jgi:hypothetical protein